MPASRRQRATTRTPRSWPSRPTLAISTRMFSAILPPARERDAGPCTRGRISYAKCASRRSVGACQAMWYYLPASRTHARDPRKPARRAHADRAGVRCDPRRDLRRTPRACGPPQPGSAGRASGDLPPARRAGADHPARTGFRPRHGTARLDRGAARPAVLPRDLRAARSVGLAGGDACGAALHASRCGGGTQARRGGKGRRKTWPRCGADRSAHGIPHVDLRSGGQSPALGDDEAVLEPPPARDGRGVAGRRGAPPALGRAPATPAGDRLTRSRRGSPASGRACARGRQDAGPDPACGAAAGSRRAAGIAADERRWIAGEDAALSAPRPDASSAAGVVARFLKARGVRRVFALCGGHIMPLWMRIDAEGIGIVDVRDERAAVHMAHAHAEITGELGVALVTAGPGVTNAMTGIANAFVSRAPVLILSGVVPRPQENRGGLQDLAHTDLVRTITRYARTIREPSLVLQELDEAVSRAFGEGGEPGPVYVDFPTDTLRADVPPRVQLDEHFRRKRPVLTLPDPAAVEAAAELLWSARRPLVITGRGARGAAHELVRFLDALGAAYLDTGESRGLVPDGHASVVAAVRGRAMAEADVIVTVGRRLDFQLAFGSPAVFGTAQFVRVADAPSELRDNRRGAVELLASPRAALAALAAAGATRPSRADRDWTASLRKGHLERAAKLRETTASAPPGSDGRMHPNRLLAAIQAKLPADAIVVAD